MYDVVNLYYLMSTNKSFSYILCDKGIIVNLYKLHFPSFPFSLQPNKRVFHPPTFSPFQPNTQEGKLNIFYLLTFSSFHNFSSSYFFTFLTKRTPNETIKKKKPTNFFKFIYMEICDTQNQMRHLYIKF